MLHHVWCLVEPYFKRRHSFLALPTHVKLSSPSFSSTIFSRKNQHPESFLSPGRQMPRSSPPRLSVLFLESRLVSNVSLATSAWDEKSPVVRKSGSLVGFRVSVSFSRQVSDIFNLDFPFGNEWPYTEFSVKCSMSVQYFLILNIGEHESIKK